MQSDHGAFYARVVEAGRVIRLETDGTGRLIPIDEGAAPPTLAERYALSRRRYAKAAEAKVNGHLEPGQRREVVLKTLQDAPRALSTREVASGAGLWFHQAENALQWLARRGAVRRGKAVRASQCVSVWSVNGRSRP
jgi:hypothetical protein